MTGSSHHLPSHPRGGENEASLSMTLVSFFVRSLRDPTRSNGQHRDDFMQDELLNVFFRSWGFDLYYEEELLVVAVNTHITMQF